MTRKNISESQLVAIVISTIAVSTILFTIEGSLLATGIALAGISVSVLIGLLLNQIKFTDRASVRVMLAGTLLSWVLGSVVLTTGLVLMPAVFMGSFIVLASLQLFLYF